MKSVQLTVNNGVANQNCLSSIVAASKMVVMRLELMMIKLNIKLFVRYSMTKKVDILGKSNNFFRDYSDILYLPDSSLPSSDVEQE